MTKVCVPKHVGLKFSNQQLQNSTRLVTSSYTTVNSKELCSKYDMNTYITMFAITVIQLLSKTAEASIKMNIVLFVVKLYSQGIFLHIWERPEECKNVPCFFSAVLRYVRIKTGLSLEQVGCERKQVWSALVFGARPGQLC